MLGQLFSFIIVIGVIIVIHELGHFTMAKLFKIPVAAFSIGFGPKIFGFRRKETEYKVAVIPLGGYVKIHGMEDQQAAPDDPNSFYNRPRWQRFLVLFMGVGFNFILAMLLLSIALTRGIPVAQSVSMQSRIGSVEPGSPADKAGLKPDDVILEMNGEETPTWEKVSLTTLLNPNETVTVRVRRGSEVLEKYMRIQRRESTSLGYIGITPATSVMVVSTSPGMPAEKSLKPGDIIKKIDGVPVNSIEQAPALIQKSNGKPVEIVIERKEGSQTVARTFVIEPKKERIENQDRFLLGFQPGEPTVLKKLSVPQAIRESINICKRDLKLNAIFISKLFQGKLSLKATSGPFGIAKLSQATRESGFSTFLLFIGTISFDIGLINLLPIPALDGGHIFFLLLESVFRRELSIKVKERMTMIGFAFLICVMVVVLYYDVMKTGPVQRLLESFGK